jgi:hypothetical protein
MIELATPGCRWAHAETWSLAAGGQLSVQGRCAVSGALCPRESAAHIAFSLPTLVLDQDVWNYGIWYWYLVSIKFDTVCVSVTDLPEKEDPNHRQHDGSRSRSRASTDLYVDGTNDA